MKSRAQTADDAARPADRLPAPPRPRVGGRLPETPPLRLAAPTPPPATAEEDAARRLLAVAETGAMVGRQPELARLRTRWENAAAGEAAAVLLAGEPGVGKTRLAAELAAIAATDGARVLVGRCTHDAPAPYQPFAEALAPAVASQPDPWLHAQVRRHGTGLAHLLPDVAARLGGVDGLEPPGPRTRFLAAIVAAVTGLSSDPVLLVLEDLHWATPSTVLLLEHLVHGRTRAPLLVLATYRDAALHPTHPLPRLLEGPVADRLSRIFLANLSPQAVTALLVDRAAVAGKGAAVLANRLWHETEGNPLVLTEVVRDLLAAGAVGGGAVNDDVVARVGLAHDVSAVVGRRLGRPTAAIRRVLEAAAVAGSSFETGAAAELAGKKPDDVRGLLERGASLSLVAADPDHPGRFRFVHDSFRQAVYDTIPSNRRVVLHKGLAELLEERARTHAADCPPPAVLLHHRAAATPVGRSSRAVVHAERAGAAAMAVLAYEEAAAFFGQALAFLGSRGAPAARVDLLMLLGEANRLAGEPARARQSYLQAAAVARSVHDGPRLAETVLGLGEVVGVWGADGVLIALLEQAIDANPADPSIRAKLLARLAQARAALDTPDERKAQSDEAWELAWDSRDPATMSAVLRARHEALSAPDDLEDRIEIDGELYAMAKAAKDDELALLAHGWRLVDLLEQGHLTDADRDRKLHYTLARRSGDPRHHRDAEAWAAMWALLHGRAQQAMTYIDHALALGQDAHDPDAASVYWSQLLDLLLEWGTDADLAELLERWPDMVDRHDGDPAWRSALALLLARAGRAAEAAEQLDDLLAEDCADLPLDRAWLPTVAAAGDVAVLVGDHRAPVLAALLQPYARRMIVVGPGLVCRGSVGRVLGGLAAATGRWVEAERHFQAALATHERLKLGPLVARTRSELGRALARKGGGELHLGRVRTILHQAAEEAAELGMVRLASETEAAIASLS